MKTEYKRPVWLANYGYIGANATAQKQVEAIWDSGVFDEDSSIDSVFYFAAKDVDGGLPHGSNLLEKEVGGSTIGLELLKKCTSGTRSKPSNKSTTMLATTTRTPKASLPENVVQAG